MALNPKQEAFCHEYLIDFNGKQSAIRAGYSPKTAEVKASQLLTIVKVNEFLSKLQSKTAEEYKVDRTKVLKAIVEMSEDGEQEGNRRGALDMLMKHLGEYSKDNKLEVSGDALINKIEIEFIDAK